MNRPETPNCVVSRPGLALPGLVLGSLIALAGAACSKDSKPQVAESKPAPSATENGNTMNQSPDPSSDSSRQSGPTAAPNGTRPDEAFRATSDAFTAYIGQFPRIEAPQAFPLADDKIQAMKKRPLEERHRDTYLCDTGFFECKIAEQRNEFFHGYRVAISSQAVGLLYYGIGDTDVQLVFMTYNASGKPVAGLTVWGDFGDLEWGFDGELRADRTIERNRYVWVGGEEKEYVKDRSYRITATGEIEETI